MIDEIHIRDVALIRDAAFAPGAGLTVVTGETGTGKTALLGAVKLLVGERADAGLVREGADGLQVEGRFFLPDADPDGVVAVRRISAQGRSRVTLDGTLSSVRELASGIGQSVDLCGQHEHQRLLSPAYQRALLDAWGADEIAGPLARYRECLDAAEAAQAELDRLRALEDADSVALDRARFALEQIDAADPQEGEYEELLERMPRLEHGEALVQDAQAAQDALAAGGGALERIDEALSALDRIVAIDDELSDDVRTVREAYFSLEDIARTLATYRDHIDFPREELEAAQDRIAELQGLMRGFGPRMEDVFDLRDSARAQLEEYAGRDELIAAATDARTAAEEALAQAADALVAARDAVAPRFIEAVQAQLARLEMASARLTADFEPLPREEWTAWGPQAFELMFAAGEAIRPQRLGRIASGGEMSRVMLALKVVLGEVDEVDTLVFDEIDAGVGGQTARALAQVLCDLARTHQVIVVTHLPQVAVCGQVHYLVTKTDGAAPETRLSAIEGDARVDEIARMLAGEVNETARGHARSLLAEQGGQVR